MAYRLFCSTSQTATLDVVLALADKIGIQELEGLPLRKFFVLKHRKALESALISIEDSDPKIAAILQEYIDKFV